MTAKGKPLDMLIVGAGFAGLYALYKARMAGLRAMIVEAADEVGGTWYFNRYPGARVDIESMEYSFSFSEELQQEWHWSERYAGQPELLRYAKHIADRFGLRDGIRFNTRIVAASFDEASKVWKAVAQNGDEWAARFLIMASGPLSTPNTPDFPGLEQFGGRVFHTGKWPAEKVSFEGQRVGIIGTGSSAVQAIPIIAAEARELTVFQRTAAYAVPANNGPLDRGYEAKIKAGYADFRARNRRMASGFGCLMPANPVSALAVSPERRDEMYEERWQVGGFAFLSTFVDIMRDERANATAADFIRRKIRSIVANPEVAELLCPSHTVGCKRLCVDSGYYQTFNRPNVRLVDISRHPIDRITGSGLEVNGRTFELDALVLATGFDAMTGAVTRIDLRGRSGLSIRDKWKNGPLNYLGLMVAGFPNLFNVIGPGSTSAFTNIIVAIEHHVDWITECILHMQQKGLSSIEATPEAEAAWIAHVNKVARGTIYLTCNSWYLGANIPGKPRMFMPLVGFPQYADRCAEVARKGYEGFLLAA